MMESSRRCRECGELVDPEDQFCGSCGKEIHLSNLEMDRHSEAYLQVIKGLEKGKEIALEKDQLTLGRGQDVDLYLEDSGASREHARIEHAKGQFMLVDLESSNGTFLNGRRIKGSKILSSGDLIAIGDAVIEFQLETEDNKERESGNLVPGRDQGISVDSIRKSGSSSKVLLIGGAAIAALVCIVSTLLVGALVILPVLRPDSPTVADNPNSPQTGNVDEFPPSGEDQSAPPSEDNVGFPPTTEDDELPPGMSTVQIVNNYSVPVCFINISSSEEENWGGNWLLEGEILQPGSSITFYIDTGFEYDWIVQDCDGTILIKEYGLRIWEGLNILNIEP
jgi:pSer/pThr/pTyr-binding forkhead associated (FHA) protein